MRTNQNINIERNSKENKEAFNLEDATLNRILMFQQQIATKKQKNLSLEELLDFLNRAANYNGFQLWLKDLNEQGRELSKSQKITLLLSRTSDNDLLRLYDVENNYDERNLQSIDRMIGKFDTTKASSQESRKKTVKSLLR